MMFVASFDGIIMSATPLAASSGSDIGGGACMLFGAILFLADVV